MSKWMFDPDEGAAFLDRGQQFSATLDLTNRNAALVTNFVMKMNDSSFGGHPAGTLLLATFHYGFNDTSILLTFYRNFARTWDQWPTLVGLETQTLIDPEGNPVVCSFDFGELDGHLGTLDLVAGQKWQRLLKFKEPT